MLELVCLINCNVVYGVYCWIVYRLGMSFFNGFDVLFKGFVVIVCGNIVEMIFCLVCVCVC